MIDRHQTPRLLLACAALICLSPALSAARPTLEVWTATPNPQGRSFCVYCDRFWADFRTNPEFHETLTAAYQIKPIYYDRNIVTGKLRMITVLPSFCYGNKKIAGYTTPEDLMVRLGLKQLRPNPSPSANPPAAITPQPIIGQEAKESLQALQNRLQGLQSMISNHERQLADLASFLASDKARQEQLDQADQSHRNVISDFQIRLRGLAAHLGRLDSRQKEQADNGLPAAPEEDSGSLIDNVLQLGRYPATWFLGPAGGAGLTALLWFYQRRKKRRPSSAPTSEIKEPLEGNSGMLERILDRMNRLENRIHKPIAVPVDSPPAEKKTIEQRYVGYENDQFRKAVAFAHEQFVRKYPGAVGSVEFIDSLVDQYLQKVDAKEQPHV